MFLPRNKLVAGMGIGAIAMLAMAVPALGQETSGKDEAFQLQTVFGWSLRIAGEANPRSLRNFLCQSNGSELLRLGCCLATERGLSIVAPVHDAVLVEGPSESIVEIVARTQEAMAEASAVILDGFRLRSDARIVRWPDRYMDERGRGFWDRVMALIADPEPVGTIR